jgi:DNA primase
MPLAPDLHHQALAYHQRLPRRLWKYLNARGIPDAFIHKYLLGWNGRRITIPIPDRAGKFAFFKLAKDPEDRSAGPKMLATPGARAELYGWERVNAEPDQAIICEGEFDRLVLEAQGFDAVTSTGGAATFRPEWAEAFLRIRRVFLCFDHDAAGQAGAERVARMIPRARIVSWPEEIGGGGDVTDFFVRLRRSREEFLHLLEASQPLPGVEQPERLKTPHSDRFRGEIDDLKSRIPIEKLVASYVELHTSGGRFLARCPFHVDRRPSFVVFPETRSFYCFGCREHGDALNFLMKVENLSFGEAVKALRRYAP